MPYQDSYVAKIREKIGHDFELVMPTIDVVIANSKGELLMIYNRDFDGWLFQVVILSQKCHGKKMQHEKLWKSLAFVRMQKLCN